MVSLESGFEDDLRDAILDDVERKAREEVAPEFETRLRQRIEDYGDRHEYDVSTLLAALDVEVTRGSGDVRIVARLPEPALLFERGTVDHEIHAKGDGVLSFIWEERHNPPEWVREEFDAEGDGYRVFLPSVEVSGLPEGRFIRNTLNEVERILP